MRAGCVCLTTTILLNRAELERLEGSVGGLPGAVASAVGKVHPGKLLVSGPLRRCVLAVPAQGGSSRPQHTLIPSRLPLARTHAVPRRQPAVSG